MECIRPIATLIVERPKWSNTVIANRFGCDRRRVRRYRQLLKGADPSAVVACDPDVLRDVLNARPGARQRYTPPDFAQLERDHPGATGRKAWRAYAAHERERGALPMGYSQFMRLRRDAFGVPS